LERHGAGADGDVGIADGDRAVAVGNIEVSDGDRPGPAEDHRRSARERARTGASKHDRSVADRHRRI
jgi:hypothetical protein